MTTEAELLERIAQLEEQLAHQTLCRQDAEADARASADIKQQFLASMSHELRTPLNGLIGASELALQTHLPADAREYVQLMHQSSLSLFEVLTGILDMARLESGQLALQPVVFDVRAAMAATVARFAPAAAGKQVAIALATGADTPLPVFGDELRFCQVLGHLVGNAVKFTEAGTVTVTLHVMRGAMGTGELTISVRDTGTGIRPEDLERIFTMFTQGDGSASRAYGGSGLGLAVSQGLARLMGGSLGVSSVYGRGATFIFRVEMSLCPVAPARVVGAAAGTSAPPLGNVTPPAPANEPCPPGADAQLTVLLAEDNLVNRTLATRILERAGCRVEVAENGAVALQMARERVYDAIFMDLQMPVMDGLQASRAIRELEGDGPRVPIIAVTANAMPGDYETCLKAGMDDYLAKPLRPADLVDKLHRWCGVAIQPA